MLNLVTIHHEGAGDPSDVARGAKGGYTYWLGKTCWQRLRSPYESYATLHYNHVSVDICLSGNRDNWDVTQQDLIFLSQIGADARARGELTDNPTVRPHRWTFNTDCPGQRTMAIWELVAQRFVNTAANTPPDPAHRPVLRAGDYGQAVTRLQHELNVGTGVHLKEDGIFGPSTLQAVYSFQAFFHLAVDGVVGVKTWRMVDYVYDLKIHKA